MKVCLFLVCVLCVYRTSADGSKSYLITAPLSLRLDAMETVVLQLFGFTDEVTVHVFLKTSMAPDHVVLVREVVTLNARNQHQGVARVRLSPKHLDRSLRHLVLHVQSAEINQHLSIAVSRSNGFLFIQTDKPLYTPHQSVKVRAFSLNQELRPANRSVFLTFKDPDQVTVDTAEMLDLSNGVPSLQNPFKIPVKPKLGVWTIEASYSQDFTSTATTTFEVKEYVLPRVSIMVEPETSYISYDRFNRFNLRVSARYLHGAPVAGAEVFLRYGYVSGKNPPVIVPNSVSRQRLSSSGDVHVTISVPQVFSKLNGPMELGNLEGKFLYIAVLLEESTGGITQEAEFATVMFLKTPYRLSLVSTPPFIKPGLPYNIQVLVKDHLDKPVNQVPVRLVKRRLIRQGQDTEEMPCPDSSISQSDGLAIFICNTPPNGVKAVFEFKTDDPALPAESQAILHLEAEAYHSPNQRYLYIDTPLPGSGLQVGHFANIQVYLAMPSYLHIPSLSYLVLSKGKVVDFGNHKVASLTGNRHSLNFRVTAAMVPSVRLLVYYILYGEGTNELVADSVWLDVKDDCVNGLKTDVSFHSRNYKPKEALQLNVRTNQDGLVALSAVDSALFTLRPTHRDPVATMLRHIELSDQGCGGGGGRDSADVFRLAGLNFITNANAQPHAGGAACTAVVRPKRALSPEAKAMKAASYGSKKKCCEYGMKHLPRAVTCDQLSRQAYRDPKHQRCRDVFRECCEFAQQHISLNQGKLDRSEMGADFDLAPSLVRSFFPESWMWEVQPVRSGVTLFNRRLPDSLTTWEVRAVGVFNNGVCVAEPRQVSVVLPLSLDVPLPYQLVRGEQVELTGSMYNRHDYSVMACVTLTVDPAICLLQSTPVGGAGLHSTTCTFRELPAGGVGKVTFTLMGLEPGEHTLSFTLKTSDRAQDRVEKKLRVVPEGMRQEILSGGTLDPQGLYGSERRTLLLKNQLPPNMVPNTAVDQTLTIRGEVLGDVLHLAHSPEGLTKLVNLPAGSAQAEVGGLLPLVQVYRYLETTGTWSLLKGEDVEKKSAELLRRIREGVVSLTTFRRSDFSYSVWRTKESSTWLTALVVQTLSLTLVGTQQRVPVDLESLSESVAWLIRRTQQNDGSFKEDSSFRGARIMALGAESMDRSVYLTSFVLIALKRATSIKNDLLQLRFQDLSMDSAANYISQHASEVKSVYVRAVATFALTLHDPDSTTAFLLLHSLEQLAREKGHPAVLRYWQESDVTSEGTNPEQSGQTVETTAYVLLTVLLKGRLQYASSILAWLTQDQLHGGFFSVQDTSLTLEALTEYSRVVPRAQLNQDINVRVGRNGELRQVSLSHGRPVATPIQVKTADDITVTTGYGRGVSSVTLQTVYYQTTSASQNRCNFDLSIQVVGSHVSDNPSMQAPHLVACAKYRPPPNEVYTESSLTVMKIQMPTGVEAYLEDLQQFRDSENPVVSHYELQGDTVIIQLQTVPSDIFVCVGFRVRTGFRVGGASKSVFSVSEPQDKGSLCSTLFSYEQQKLERLCVDDQCQCMTAACATFRGKVDPTLTAANHNTETCRPHIRYAFKLRTVSAVTEGDFLTFTATVVEVLKNTEPSLEVVRSGTEVQLVKKVSCSSVDLQKDQQYLVMGASGTQIQGGSRYRLPLDSDVLVALWPAVCGSPECLSYTSQLEDFALDLQLFGCS
ncbi:unnamed protein product [Ophioblennius macclurei]